MQKLKSLNIFNSRGYGFYFIRQLYYSMNFIIYVTIDLYYNKSIFNLVSSTKYIVKKDIIPSRPLLFY